MSSTRQMRQVTLDIFRALQGQFVHDLDEGTG
jgi:hypothetical protein